MVLFIKPNTDNQRNVETTDLTTHPLWMVAFLVSLIIHIIFISATLMSRRYDMIYIFVTCH